MIKSVYIVSLTGVPLYIYDINSGQNIEEDNTEQVTLFSGVLSAIQSLLSDFNVGEAKYFATESNEIFMEISNNFGLVLIKDLNDGYDAAIIRKILSEMITALTFAFQDLNESTIQSLAQKQKIQAIIETTLKKYETVTEQEALQFGEVCKKYQEKMAKNVESSVSFLLETVKSNLDVVLHALFTKKTIAICGDKETIQKVIDGITLMSPFQTLKVIPYTTAFIEPEKADLIGITKELEPKYKRSKAVIFCIEKQSVYGQKNNSYLKNLIKELRKLSDEAEIRKKLTYEMCTIFSYCDKLMALFHSGNFEKKKYEELKKRIPENLFNLVIDICKAKEPEIECTIKKLEFFGTVF